MKVGENRNVIFIWSSKEEKWDEDCVGHEDKDGELVMFWGMIIWNWKGPYHIWKKETSRERQEAEAAIAEINHSV